MAAPDPDLRRLQAFVNTAELEDGEDAIGVRAQASVWLTEIGLTDDVPGLSVGDHERLLKVREALRRLGAANNGAPLDAGELRDIDELFTSVRLVPSLRKDARVLLD